MLFALEENCSLKFVRDGTLKLLLLLSRGEVVLEFELNTGFTLCIIKTYQVSIHVHLAIRSK